MTRQPRNIGKRLSQGERRMGNGRGGRQNRDKNKGKEEGSEMYSEQVWLSSINRDADPQPRPLLLIVC